MNSKIKQQWIDALRSGDYKQGKHTLRWGDNFCCLGVLCDLASKEDRVIEKRNPNGSYEYGKEGAIAGLPEEVYLWSQLYFTSQSLIIINELINLNDTGVSFQEISEIIEKEL